MIVQVLAHHLAHGTRGSNIHNPVALALQESDEYAVVTPERAHRRCPHGPLCVARFCGITDLPYAVKQWLRRYHGGEYVGPLTFVL